MYLLQTKSARPGVLSAELKVALGMAEDGPPPWLINMQRYGPPPSYPALKIPGLNAPIPAGATFGYGQPSHAAFSPCPQSCMSRQCASCRQCTQHAELFQAPDTHTKAPLQALQVFLICSPFCVMFHGLPVAGWR